MHRRSGRSAMGSKSAQVQPKANEIEDERKSLKLPTVLRGAADGVEVPSVLSPLLTVVSAPLWFKALKICPNRHRHWRSVPAQTRAPRLPSRAAERHRMR